MRDERLIEGVLQSLSFFRGASLGQLAIVAKQCWTLEASRGDTNARHALRPAARRPLVQLSQLASRNADFWWLKSRQGA